MNRWARIFFSIGLVGVAALATVAATVFGGGSDRRTVGLHTATALAATLVAIFALAWMIVFLVAVERLSPGPERLATREELDALARSRRRGVAASATAAALVVAAFVVAGFSIGGRVGGPWAIVATAAAAAATLAALLVDARALRRDGEVLRAIETRGGGR